MKPFIFTERFLIWNGMEWNRVGVDGMENPAQSTSKSKRNEASSTSIPRRKRWLVIDELVKSVSVVGRYAPQLHAHPPRCSSWIRAKSA